MRQVALLPGAIIFSRDLSLLWLRLQYHGSRPVLAALSGGCVSPTARMASSRFFGFFFYVFCGCEAACCRKYQVSRLEDSGPGGLKAFEQKARYRQLLLARRRSFVESGAVHSARAALFRRMSAVLSDHGIQGVVAAYLPIRGEPDPIPAVVQSGLSLALPVVLGQDQPLTFRLWRPDLPLERGLWGTRHPLPSQPGIVPDFLFVPLVGFAVDGRRLGYGQGFYDRTFAAWAECGAAPCAFGVAWECQREDGIPTEPHDVHLDGIVTNEAIYVCS